MKKTILTDVDGVLLDWIEPFLEFINFKNLDDVVDEEAIAFVESDAIRSLKPINKSFEYVPALWCDGYEFIGISSISSNPAVKENRLINLRSVYGDVFSDCHCLETNAPKKNFLKSMVDAYGKDNIAFWVEDTLENAIAGVELGLKTYLMDPASKYDMVDDRIIVVSDWKEIYEDSLNANV